MGVATAAAPEKVLSVCSDRMAPLASHHFPVSAVLDVAVASMKKRILEPKLKWTALKEPSVKKHFLSEEFASEAGD